MANPLLPVNPSPFDIDAAIKRQLDKVPVGDHKIVGVLTGEMTEVGGAKARLAVVNKNKFGKWDLQSKVYVEVGEHVKPTVGAEIVLMR